MSINPHDKTKYRNILAGMPEKQAISSEILGLKKKDVFRIGNSNLSGIKRAHFFDSFISAARVSEILPSMYRHRQILEKNGKEFYTLNLINRKNKHKPRKMIVGYMSDSIERKMCNFIIDKWKDCQDTDKLYKNVYKNRFAVYDQFSKIKVPVIIRTREGDKDFEISLFPHLLRHSRLSNLVNQYGYDGTKLALFAGWSDERQFNVYVSTDWQIFTDV